MTIVGEKGVNVSGDQRARIAVARALYNDADISLLNDPRAVVDHEEMSEPLLYGVLKTIPDNKSIIVNETAAVGAVTWTVWYKLFISTAVALLIIVVLVGEAIFDVCNRWLSLW